MATATKTKLLTYEEWLNLPEVEGRQEAVNGELRPLPPTTLQHAKIVQRFTSAFVRQLDEEKVQILGSVFGLVIRRDPIVCWIPDLALFEKATLVEIDNYAHSAPGLVIEVLSPANTRQERAEKLRDYESIGVPEVWVVSPQAETVEVLRLRDGKLQKTALVNDGELRPERFPEATVRVATIFAL